MLLIVAVLIAMLSGAGIPLFSVYSKFQWTEVQRRWGWTASVVAMFIAIALIRDDSLWCVALAWFLSAFVSERIAVPYGSRFFGT